MGDGVMVAIGYVKIVAGSRNTLPIGVIQVYGI
jgi:hypothetical protein